MGSFSQVNVWWSPPLHFGDLSLMQVVVLVRAAAKVPGKYVKSHINWNFIVLWPAVTIPKPAPQKWNTWYHSTSPKILNYEHRSQNIELWALVPKYGIMSTWANSSSRLGSSAALPPAKAPTRNLSWLIGVLESNFGISKTKVKKYHW